VPGKRRQNGADRRAVDAGQHLEDEAGNGHQRAGIARRNTGIRLALLDQIDRDPHRRVFLGAQRQRRRLIHGDHFRGMANGNPTDRSVAEKGPNALGKTNQDDAHVGMIAHETRGPPERSPEGPWSPPMQSMATVMVIRWQTKEKAGSSPSREAACPIQRNHSLANP
jgi:hypothetical protein